MVLEERTVLFLPDYDVERCLQFGHYKYAKAQPKLKQHEHPNVVEICFCIKGKQHYIIKNELFKLQGNDIVIIPPNIEHSTGEYPEDKGELYWLQIILNNNEKKLCNLSYEQSQYLLNGLEMASLQVFKGAFQIKYLLEKLMNELQTGTNILSKIQTNLLIVQILLDVLSLSKMKQRSTPVKRLIQIDEYIATNLNRIIYVDELADISNISVGYFKYWFKNTVGIPPKEYVNRLKIEQAKTDLLKGKTITEVAFDLGFSSSQYFSTTFKKFTGYTPKLYIAKELVTE